MELLATNGPLGASYTVRKGVLYPLQPYLPLRFVASLRLNSPSLFASTRRSGIRAAQLAEKETNTAFDKFLEKEVDFSPSFTDYVKVLEAVKIDRFSRTRSGNGGFSPRRRSSRSLGEDGDGGSSSDHKGKDRQMGDDGKGRRISTPRSGNYSARSSRGRVGWGLGSGEGEREWVCKTAKGVEERERRRRSMDNDAKLRGYVRYRDKGFMGSREDIGTRMDGRHVLEDKKSDANAARIDMWDMHGVEILSDKETDLDTNRGFIKRSQEGRKKNNFGTLKKNGEKSRLGRPRREILVERLGNKVSSNSIGGLDMNGKHHASTRRKTSGSGLRGLDSDGISDNNWGRNSGQNFGLPFGHPSDRNQFISRSTYVAGGLQKRNAETISLDGGALDDRAAFKNFEVFTDVNNRPRVLRMEMEERIQNLAKWLNAADVNMPEWQFSRMMHNAKIKFTDHSILRVVQILGEFGNWKRVLQLVEWLQSSERFKSYKSKYIYTAVLDALGKAKRTMEALNIFYLMRQEKSSYPDLAAYHCIAVTLGQAGLMKELFDVIDCMKTLPSKKFDLGLDQKWNPRLEPDLVVYNAVLNACVQKKQWEGAFWVLQQLKEHGIKPSSTTYGLVMEVMLACGKYNLVYEFFNKVESTSIPNTLSYKVLINALWREGKVDEAVVAVENMEKRGIVGSASLYYDLARCLCTAGRCNEALFQINKICKVAKRPLVVTYTGLIQACVDSGRIEDGEFIFNEMQKFCSPNIVTCNIMLKSYLKNGMYEEGKGLFKKILDDSHCIKNQNDLVGKVIPDKCTFNVMMEAASVAGNWEDFEYAFMQMLHYGFHFDKKRHLQMVVDAAKDGKEIALEQIWEHFSVARNPPLLIVKERLLLKLRDGNLSSAISCLEFWPQEDPGAFSVQSLFKLLKFNAGKLRVDTIARLVHEIRNLLEEGELLQPIYQNLLSACMKFLGPSMACS